MSISVCSWDTFPRSWETSLAWPTLRTHAFYLNKYIVITSIVLKLCWRAFRHLYLRMSVCFTCCYQWSPWQLHTCTRQHYWETACLEESNIQWTLYAALKRTQSSVYPINKCFTVTLYNRLLEETIKNVIYIGRITIHIVYTHRFIAPWYFRALSVKNKHVVCAPLNDRVRLVCLHLFFSQ